MRKKFLVVAILGLLSLTVLPQTSASTLEKKTFTLDHDQSEVISLGLLNDEHEITMSFTANNAVYVCLIDDKEINSFLDDGTAYIQEYDSGTYGGFYEHIQNKKEYSILIKNFGTSPAQVTIEYELSGGVDFTPYWIVFIVVVAVIFIISIGIRVRKGEKITFVK